MNAPAQNVSVIRNDKILVKAGSGVNVTVVDRYVITAIFARKRTLVSLTET